MPASSLNIVADAGIPFALEAFSTLGRVELVPPEEIRNSALRRADALIVRAVTRVDESLLRGTPVKFVGTATIGTDHVDTNWLHERGIVFADAAGCNARAVAEYTLSAVVELVCQAGRRLRDLTVGVIGLGRIGGRVAAMTQALGMRVLKNDPPLQRATGDPTFLPLEDVLEADVITLHVPLKRTGPDATYHLLDAERLIRIRRDAILINTSRGAVVDNPALRELLAGGSGPRTVLDVWENEPDIDVELLSRVEIGTPHIAGYSLEGKARGTQMVYEALCAFLGREPVWKPRLPPPEQSVIALDGRTPIESLLLDLIRRICDLRAADASLRKTRLLSDERRRAAFEALRRSYPLRREFPNFSVRLRPPNRRAGEILRRLGFRGRNRMKE